LAGAGRGAEPNGFCSQRETTDPDYAGFYDLRRLILGRKYLFAFIMVINDTLIWKRNCFHYVILTRVF
jgi:hypothetical protein